VLSKLWNCAGGKALTIVLQFSLGRLAGAAWLGCRFGPTGARGRSLSRQPWALRRQTENWSDVMIESKNDFRKALSSVVDVKGREASRQIDYRRQHQLIGALTRRP